MRWVLSLLATALVASPAFADENVRYEIVGDRVMVELDERRAPVDVPCPNPLELARDGDRLLVACGAHGVIIMSGASSGAPKYKDVIKVDGEAAGFTFDASGWHVRVVKTDAPSLAVLESTEPERYPDTAIGRVESAYHGEARVSPLPRARPGQGVKLAGERKLGRVLEVEGDVATVELPLHAATRAGDGAELVQRRGGSLDVYPRRIGNLASFAAEEHLFAGLSFGGSSGLQTMSTFAAEYRATLPFALRATLAHAAMSFTSPTNIAAIDASAGASYDTQPFEVGLSAGVMSINDGSYQHAGSAFELVPLVRFGAVDGISLLATMDVVTVQGRVEFGGAFGCMTIPLTRHTWLLIRGGAGRSGLWRADFAVRALLRGDGGHGSLFALVSTGFAATFFTPVADEYLIGPGGGFGIEYRP